MRRFLKNVHFFDKIQHDANHQMGLIKVCLNIDIVRISPTMHRFLVKRFSFRRFYILFAISSRIIYKRPFFTWADQEGEMGVRPPPLENPKLSYAS